MAGVNRAIALTGRILLLQPWIEDFYATDCRIQPIGLAYLAGALARRFPEYETTIYDCLAGGEKRTLAYPHEFAYLRRYYGRPRRGPFALFHQYYRFGKSIDRIRADLLARAPEAPVLIGIASLFTPYYRQSLALAAVCREIFPDTPIVMGGNHATLHPRSLLAPPEANGGADFVLRGEGEDGICQLVEALRGERSFDSIANLVTRDHLTTEGDTSAAGLTLPEPEAPELNDIARPIFTGLNPNDYSYNQQPMSFLITSRSCPHHCSFCSIHAVFGQRYRVREVDDIFQEILERYKQGVRHFDIEDDNFTVNKREVGRLLDRIIAARLPVKFSAMNGLSYISLDRELLTKMRDAGFESLNLALVSADQLALRFADRPHTLERFENILTIAAELNLRVTAYFIAGMPHQTIAEMWQTLGTLAAGQCLVGASPFYFTPGSPIHRRERDNPAIRLASQKFSGDALFSARLTAMDLECDQFDRDDIYTMFRLTRVINYVKAGLDQGLAPDDAYFKPAITVFAHGHWGDGAGTDEAPFSPRVADEIEKHPPMIRGYATDRACVWTGSGLREVTPALR